jgi:hypothetical protein
VKSNSVYKELAVNDLCVTNMAHYSPSWLDHPLVDVDKNLCHHEFSHSDQCGGEC